ncbi:MAG: cold-shock protein [Flavipsychrobacter sp.]|jgi:cold shock CspA family protein|nr:cold-shock protein [Flavipsychrobacter sp.]
MGETFSKKEKEKKRAKEKQDKAERMKERKANSTKGKSLEDMMAYLDENGNIVSTPPVAGRKREINIEDIQLGAAKQEAESPEKTGVVSFFNEAKGYGFITDGQTRENIFVHANNLLQPIKDNDKVTYERERTPKGWSAINVKKA